MPNVKLCDQFVNYMTIFDDGHRPTEQRLIGLVTVDPHQMKYRLQQVANAVRSRDGLAGCFVTLTDYHTTLCATTSKDNRLTL